MYTVRNLIYVSFLFLTALGLIYGCSIEVEESERSVTTQYVLTITASEGGSVSPDASGTYDEGTTITISATPDKGYKFNRWLGSDFDNNGCAFARYCRTAITMDSNRDVKAFFQLESE
jgi:hypothetical protein